MSATQFSPLVAAQDPSAHALQVPAAVRESPVKRVPPASRLPQTVLAAQLVLSPTAAQKSAAQAVHVRSAVAVGAFTSTRSVVPPSEVPAHVVIAAQSV